MLANLLLGLASTEVRHARRRLHRCARRGMVFGILWLITGLLIAAAVACFVIAAHLALATVMNPIAAFAVTGAGLLMMGSVIALITLAAHALTRRR